MNQNRRLTMYHALTVISQMLTVLELHLGNKLSESDQTPTTFHMNQTRTTEEMMVIEFSM